MIKIGDTLTCVIAGISYTSKIVGMEATKSASDKYGDPVSTVDIGDVRCNRVVFDLENGKFVYSDQVRTINGIKVR